jgi:hypothetical protein
MQTRSDLLQAIQRLPAKGYPRSYKSAWTRWLAKYPNQNRDAEFIYNALNLPEWVIWLAAASGANPELVQAATNAIDPQELPQTQAAAARRVLPWSLVSKLLTASAAWPLDPLMLDLNEIYASTIEQTTKQTLIEARLGQGQFRARVSERWDDKCAVTGCSITPILRASHIKPWSVSADHERLDPANGLLLIAHIDALFDCGLITFADDGRLLTLASVGNELEQLRLPDRLRREPAETEKPFLVYHRRHVFADNSIDGM